MRTIKLTREADIGGGQSICLSTEVILNEDASPEEAHAAGAEAETMLDAFLDGVNEVSGV